MEAIKLSFIVATVDRDDKLQECISSIEKAHEHSKEIAIEILVVIQKAKQKKQINTKFADLCVFFYIDKIGLSAARNYAIEQSHGRYLIFLDDDASVSENFISVLVEQINRYSDTKAFCGRLIDPVSQVPFSVLFYNKKVKQLNRFNYQYFMGSAHVLSRAIIRKVGNYDERFGVGAKYYGSEETDMFFRLKAAKEQVLYLPELVFYHPIPVSPEDYVYKYSYAMGAMLTKNCIINKPFFHVYWLIIAERMIKSLIRLLQKAVFKGKYSEKDNRYHYASVVKGTFKGIKDFLRNER